MVHDTWLKKERSCSSMAHSTEPRAKLPKYGKPRRQPEDLATPDFRWEKPGHRTYSSKTFTNSNLAAQRNLVEESAKKYNSYSEWKLSSQKTSVPSETSGRGQEGNQGKATGSDEGRKCIRDLTSSSRSQCLLAKGDKGKRFRCIVN